MESRLDHNEINDTLRRLNRIFVQKRETGQLLSAICETLITVKQFASVWIALLDRNNKLKQFAHEGLAGSDKDLRELFEQEKLNYCSRLAIEKGSFVIVDKNPDNCGKCPVMESTEIQKSISFPVYFQTELMGVVGITLTPGCPFNETDKTLLLEFSEVLGNALNTLKLEEGKAILTDTINRITKSIRGKSSKEVIDSFMQNLLKSLDADYAFMGRLVSGYHDRIKTISVSDVNGIIENFEYPLEGTPCEKVITKDICCFPQGVAESFPKDFMLKDMGIEAYIGTPLLNSNNEVKGIMVVLKKTPFVSETIARYIFKVFASRASSELMRYNTEQRILESENQYQELIESSKNPIYIIIGHHYALVNSAWLKMFEFTLDEVMSPDFSIHQIVAPESHELIQTRLDNFISGISQPFRYELKAVSKSGRKYDLDVSVAHLNWHGKRAVQGVYLNITGVKRKEKQLAKALSLVDENYRMKTAFLANLSQEIQTFLNTVTQNATAQLVRDDLDPASKEFAEDLEKTGSHLLGNINDILDITKIEKGELTLSPEKFRFKDLINEAIDYFAPAALKKGVVLKCCNKRSDKIIIEADKLRVRQILFNLISNAVKFTEHGKIEIDYVQREDDVRVSISDTGIGIAPEKQKSLYQSFIDPNGKLTGDYDGSGLGLIVTRSLVQLIRGKIWIESNPEGGSTFYVTIPLA